MINKFWTSDLHFNHHNVIGYCNRPYETAHHMNEALISNWNSVVRTNDIVYVLGDVFFCQAPEARQIMHRLNGLKRLVPGNHDKMIRKEKSVQDLFDEILPDLYQEYIDGVLVVMCHYPMHSWNKAFHGSYNLHGHVHAPKPHDGKCRRYDVGVDANYYTPVRWSEIKKSMEAIERVEPSGDRNARET